MTFAVSINNTWTTKEWGQLQCSLILENEDMNEPNGLDSLCAKHSTNLAMTNMIIFYILTIP